MDPAPTIEAVDFVTVEVGDWEAARDFYGEKLGLPISASYAAVSISEYEAGGLTLQIRGVGTPRTMEGGSPIALRVADVELARRSLESRGVVFEGETFDSGVCLIARFRDPAGNRLVLHRRYVDTSSGER